MRALVGYVPVIHAGYLKLFERHRGSDLWVLGKDILAEHPHIERDMRALDPETTATLARALRLFTNVGMLTLETYDRLRHYRRIVMPDEEVSRAFAAEHLASIQGNISFERVFLRWDKMAAGAFKPLTDVRTVGFDGLEADMMGVAYAAARMSSDWWRQIGAVAVKDGVVIASAHNKHYPSEHSPYIVGDPRSNFDAGQHIDRSTALHAECGLVAGFASTSGLSLADADVFVTTFPCPPCATLLAACGIRRLYFAEGYSIVAAREILESRGVEIVQVTNRPPS